MNCNKCGFVITETDQVCPNCGNPLTALSHNKVVTQDIPEKADNTNVNNEPVITKDPVVAPTTVIPNTPKIEENNIFVEAPVTPVTPVTSESKFTATRINIVDKKKIIKIVLIILGILVIGFGIYFGVQYFLDNYEPDIIIDEEEEVLEKSYYPINEATNKQIIDEFEYYRKEVYNLEDLKSFKDILKLPAYKIYSSDDTVNITFASYNHSEKIDHISRIRVTSYDNNSIETLINLNIYDKTKVTSLFKEFINYYEPKTLSYKKYTGSGAYEDGYAITLKDNKTLVIGYVEVEENDIVYYEITIDGE